MAVMFEDLLAYSFVNKVSEYTSRMASCCGHEHLHNGLRNGTSKPVDWLSAYRDGEYVPKGVSDTELRKKLRKDRLYSVYYRRYRITNTPGIYSGNVPLTNLTASLFNKKRATETEGIELIDHDLGTMSFVWWNK
jgi:hypothetical protein